MTSIAQSDRLSATRLKTELQRQTLAASDQFNKISVYESDMQMYRGSQFDNESEMKFANRSKLGSMDQINVLATGQSELAQTQMI